MMYKHVNFKACIIIVPSSLCPLASTQLQIQLSHIQEMVISKRMFYLTESSTRSGVIETQYQANTIGQLSREWKGE